jgi:hypothetical protein
MISTGFAYFECFETQVRAPPVRKFYKVNCGLSSLEAIFGDSLGEFGLCLPRGNIIIDRENKKINMTKRLCRGEKEDAYLLYVRNYFQQENIQNLINEVNKKVSEKIPADLKKVGLSDIFERFLVNSNNMEFTEKAIFNFDKDSSVIIKGHIIFEPLINMIGPLVEKQEYLVYLEGRAPEKISEIYRGRHNTSLSERRGNFLRKTRELELNAFLRKVDITPTRSKNDYAERAMNLKKTCLFLAEGMFKKYF